MFPKGILEDQITVCSASSRTMFRQDEHGRPTDDVTCYELVENVEIESNEVDKVTNAARSSTEPIEKGVVFRYHPPQCFCTKLSDLRIEIVAQTRRDAG